MSALIQDITIEQGATFQREYTVTDSRGAGLSDFTSYTSRGTLRDNSGTLVLSFTVTITGPKTVLVSLTAAQTAALPASTSYTHKYDIEVQSPSGVVYRIAQGRAEISAEQTK